MGYRKLKQYLFRTFAVSWTVWLILALLVKNNIVTFSSLPGTVLFLGGGFAPAVSAFSLREERSFDAMICFITSGKPGGAVTLLLFCLLALLTVGLSSMELNPEVPWHGIPALFLTCTLIGGGNEEPGWRGTMQSALEEKMALPIAALVTGAVWSVWHLPLWLIDGAPQRKTPFLLFSIYAICLSLWLACVYRKTNRVFYCALLHGFSNLLMSVFVLKVNWILVLGVAVMDIIAILLWYGEERGRGSAQKKAGPPL